MAWCPNTTKRSKFFALPSVRPSSFTFDRKATNYRLQNVLRKRSACFLQMTSMTPNRTLDGDAAR